MTDTYYPLGHIAPTRQVRSRNSFLKSNSILENHPNLEITKMWNETETNNDDENEVLHHDHN